MRRVKVRLGELGIVEGGSACCSVLLGLRLPLTSKSKHVLVDLSELYVFLLMGEAVEFETWFDD